LEAIFLATKLATTVGFVLATEYLVVALMYVIC